ncbi:MAG TPA: ROK family protein [Cyanobacteria bacterium UBA10660]|nr:glucokinase ROK family [Clostridium sp. CAG:813]DAA83219.1 MAG TPA: ROK family protein [Candidatus Gastranaerophilales bacterium HUM_1]HAS94312.1 ROK family protein [Cyanobacteria bacterium UBA10660]
MAKRIGIDVGGTNVKIALVDDNGKIIYSNSVPTYAKMGYEYTVNNIKQAIKDLMKETNTTPSDIEGIGFDFPGQVDCKTGVVKLAPNIPGWVNVPIAQMIEDEFHIPTRIDNDVRCAALGELKFGAGRGCENFICITVGTGIGSGIVINGKVVRGATNAAGELGHIKLQMNGGPICGCGDTGCLEAFASGPAIVAMAQEYIKGGKSTKFREMAAVEGGEITPYMVAKAAEEGDPVAKRIFEIVGEYIGIGLTSVINLLNPERVIIGGGVAESGELLLGPIRKTIKERAMVVAGNAVEIVPAQLGNSAGVIGASMLIEG